MADLLKRNEEVYKKWESKSAPHLARRHRPPPPSQRFDKNKKPHQVFRNNQNNFEPRPRNHGNFPFMRMPRYRDLAKFKMVPSVSALNKTRPFMGLSCSKCTPLSRASLPQPYIPSLPLYNALIIPSRCCTLPVILESLAPLYYVLQRKCYFHYPDVSRDIIENERYLTSYYEDESGVESSSENNNNNNDERERGDPTEEHLAEKKNIAKKFLATMKASVSPIFLRVATWFLYKVLGSIFTSVQVHKGHIEMLKAAGEEDIPIVYVPTHRSHLDYILISFILYVNDLKVPLVAAGENLLIPVFSFILRRLGAFYVRRRLDQEPGQKDYLYRSVLQNYIIESLKAGHSMEIFIEGGRSRNGMTRMPKTGLLSFVVDSVMKGDIEDVLISPVSISYEKLVEGNFLQEQLGKEKKSETFLATLRSIWTILHSHFGSVRIDFGQPFSLKEFLRKDDLQYIFSRRAMPSLDTPPSSPTSSSSGSGSLCGKGPARRKLKTLIENLANHITYDSTSSTALMSTQLIAFLLITKHRKGATHQQLICSFDWLRDELEKRKKDVGFSGESSSVIKYALKLLGKELITTETREWPWWQGSKLENTTLKFLVYTPIIELPYVIELQYYANVVVPVFLLDSIVINALYALLDADICYFHLCDSKFSISRQDLINKAKELCGLFQFEVLFTPPCGDIVSVINEVIEELIAKDCLHVIGAVKNAGPCLQKILANPKSAYSFESSDDDDEFSGHNYSQQLKVDLSEESIDYLEFMRSIASPFIESYWIASCTLLKLIHTTMEERVFLKEAQATAEEKLCHGLLQYEESFGLETMKNALRLFLHRKIIDYTYKGNLRLFYIMRHCDIEYSDVEQNDEQNPKEPVECDICVETIDNVISKIEEFRK